MVASISPLPIWKLPPKHEGLKHLLKLPEAETFNTPVATLYVPTPAPNPPKILPSILPPTHHCGSGAQVSLKVPVAVMLHSEPITICNGNPKIYGKGITHCTFPSEKSASIVTCSASFTQFFLSAQHNLYAVLFTVTFGIGLNPVIVHGVGALLTDFRTLSTVAPAD